VKPTQQRRRPAGIRRLPTGGTAVISAGSSDSYVRGDLMLNHQRQHIAPARRGGQDGKPAGRQNRRHGVDLKNCERSGIKTMAEWAEVAATQKQLATIGAADDDYTGSSWRLSKGRC